MPEISSPPNPETQKGPSSAELLQLFDETDDVNMAKKISEKLRGQSVTVRDKDGSEQEGWSVRGVNYVVGDEKNPGGWQVVLSGKKKEVDASGKARFPRKYVFASELASWQPKPDEPKPASEISPELMANLTKMINREPLYEETAPEPEAVEVKELTEEEIEEAAREDARNRELDEQLLSNSERFRVSTENSLRNRQDTLVYNWRKIKTILANHKQVSPVLGMRKHAYDNAKKSYLSKKARAEAAESRWVKSIRERGVRRAEKKLEQKREALRNHIDPMNKRVVLDKYEAHKREKATREAHELKVRNIVNKKAEAELRKTARDRLRDEGYGKKERKAAVELLLSDASVKADVMRAGRILIEHANSEKQERKINREQGKFGKRVERLNSERETTVNSIAALNKAIHEMTSSVADLNDNIAEVHKRIEKLMKARREATVNDDIVELNRHIAAEMESSRKLKNDLSDTMEHLDELQKRHTAKITQRTGLEGELKVAQEVDADFQINISQPQEKATEEVGKRRDVALDELVSNRKETS